MASKGLYFSGRLRTGPAAQISPGGREPANQSDPREAGAQRGVAHPGKLSQPGDPDMEIDLLGDGGRRSGGWRSGVAIVAALSLFVGVLWYGYNWGIEQLSTTRIPMIVADTTPLKSRPESPGGIEVLNQDVAVLNDSAPDPGKPQAERLLPPPEVPQMAQSEAPPTMSVAEVENLLGPPLETAAGAFEKVVAAEQDQPPAAPKIAAASLPEATAAPALPEPKTEAMLAPEPPAALPVVPPAAPPVATSEPAPQVAALPKAQSGNYVVQLASLRSKDGAAPAWARMKSAHPALLGDRELAIQRVDLGDRGIFFRVQAGFFADRAGARELCTALKARGQDCLVAKR